MVRAEKSISFGLVFWRIKKIGLILCINAVPAFYHWLKMLLKVFKPKMARAIHLLKSLFYEGF